MPTNTNGFGFILYVFGAGIDYTIAIPGSQNTDMDELNNVTVLQGINLSSYIKNVVFKYIFIQKSFLNNI